MGDFFLLFSRLLVWNHKFGLSNSLYISFVTCVYRFETRYLLCAVHTSNECRILLSSPSPAPAQFMIGIHFNIKCNVFNAYTLRRKVNKETEWKNKNRQIKPFQNCSDSQKTIRFFQTKINTMLLFFVSAALKSYFIIINRYNAHHIKRYII